MRPLAGIALVGLLAVPALAADAPVSLIEGLGSHSRKVDTRSPEAQRFFDQGLVLSYGFNHAAAGRAFAEALRRDPACAMCAWGVALVLGPHINAAMEASAVSPACGSPSEYRGGHRSRHLSEQATLAAVLPSPLVSLSNR